MNNRTLFELIGTADEELLEHSERRAPERTHSFKLKKALILAAAVIAALAVTATAAAVSEGPSVLGWILDAFSHSGFGYIPSHEVIQAQIKEGEWFTLNGENVAVIVPETPVKILLSDDGGTSWRESVVQGSSEMEFWGDIHDEVQYYGGYIGFFGETGGYLVLTAGVAMNNQPMRIYLTDDGGGTWQEIGNPYGGGYHISVLTGAGFATPEIGFISYRYYEDAGPDIWWTRDGGDSWEKLAVTMPEEYSSDEYRFTPQTPVFDGAEGVYPIAVVSAAEKEDIIYMHSSDYGLTWSFEP